ncbi:methyl-accepting chemotaxis protein [Bacillus luti]|nr:chemotaxis protein [Bacillus cereus]
MRLRNSVQSKLFYVFATFGITFASLISYVDYEQFKSELYKKEAESRTTIEHHISDSIRNIDDAYSIFDKDLEKTMKKNSESLVHLYEQNPNFDTWNFKELKEQNGGMDIYIVEANEKNEAVILNSSFDKDIGLNFGVGDFSNLLIKRIKGDEFYADGMDLEEKTGKIRKYSYIPTPDHKYLIELGLLLEDGEIFKRFDFLKTADKMQKEYHQVYNVTLFNSDALSIGKTDKKGKSIKLKGEHLEAFEKASKTQQAQGFDGQFNKKDAQYRYIPYLADSDKEALTNKRVIEIVFNDDELQAALAKSLNTFLLKLALILILSMLVAIMVAKKAMKPINETVDEMDQIRNLKLKNDEIEVVRKDEFGQIYKSLNSMRSTLKEIVGALKHSSGSLFENAVTIQESIKVAQIDSERTALETEELLANFSNTGLAVQNIEAAVHEIESIILEFTREITYQLNTASENRSSALKMQAQTQESIEKAISLYRDVKSQLEKALEQSKSVNDINQIANTILKLSEKTDVLSINAQIESAKAGEYGKGFSVVANEIKRLAQQSSEAVSDIQNIITHVNGSVTDLSEQASLVLSFIDENVLKDYKLFHETSEKHNQDAEGYHMTLSTFHSSFEEFSEAFGNIRESIENTNKAMYENQMVVSNIAKQTDSILLQTNKIGDKSKNNEEAAKELKDLLGKFKEE